VEGSDGMSHKIDQAGISSCSETLQPLDQDIDIALKAMIAVPFAFVAVTLFVISDSEHSICGHNTSLHRRIMKLLRGWQDWIW